MGNGSIVTSVTVTDSTGTSAVQNTDFALFVGPDKYTYLARIAASMVLTSGEEAHVNYTYTPYSAVKLKVGGPSTISPRVIKLTNTNAEGKEFSILLYAARNQKGISLDFPSDEELKNYTPSFSLKALKDLGRAYNDQLYSINDEQGVYQA